MAESMPDAETTVLICNEGWPSEPVWMGFYDGEHWISAEGMSLKAAADSGAVDAAPTHWMDLPDVPFAKGQKAVIVLCDASESSFTFKALFEPTKERTDTPTWQMALEIVRFVASQTKKGEAASVLAPIKPSSDS